MLKLDIYNIIGFRTFGCLHYKVFFLSQHKIDALSNTLVLWIWINHFGLPEHVVTLISKNLYSLISNYC